VQFSRSGPTLRPAHLRSPAGNAEEYRRGRRWFGTNSKTTISDVFGQSLRAREADFRPVVLGSDCGHTRTGSDQRRLSVQREGGHSPGRGTIGGRHCRSVGLLRLDAPTFESLNNSRGGECGHVQNAPETSVATPYLPPGADTVVQARTPGVSG
jgi:hypothetical protein